MTLTNFLLYFKQKVLQLTLARFEPHEAVIETKALNLAPYVRA